MQGPPPAGAPIAPRPRLPRPRSGARLLPPVRDGAGDPLVRAGLYRRAAAGLALRGGAVPAARALGRDGADAAGAGGRPAHLDDPRRDPRRPARLRPVLPAGLFRGASGRGPRGLARRHVVPRRLSRRRRGCRRLQPARTACRSSASATRCPRPHRSGCSSGGSPTSSTASSGAGRRPRPGPLSSPARPRRPAPPAGSVPAPGIPRSSTRPASRAWCCSSCWRWRSASGRSPARAGCSAS